MSNLHSIGREAAIKLSESEVWKNWTAREKVEFQLFTSELSMPFDVFREAIEEVLGRGVYSHEFADIDSLQKEYLGEAPPPTFDGIFKKLTDLVDPDKVVVIVAPNADAERRSSDRDESLGPADLGMLPSKVG